MLKFHLGATAVTPSSWRWIGNEWQAGDNRIIPYPHPSLEHHMITDGVAVAVISRERRRDDPVTVAGRPQEVSEKAFRDELASAKRWPLDSLVLRADASRVSVQAGIWSVAPLYLTTSATDFIGSWDIADLQEYADASALSDREVARLLTRRHRYGHETLWSSIYRLTERSTACHRNGQLSLSYPEAAEHTLPRRLRAGADVLAAFDELLAVAVGRRAFDAERSAIELSGGLDSATVAAGLSAGYGGAVTAAALLLDGSLGVKQRNRRDMMLEAFGFRDDIVIPAPEHLPFNPDGSRGRALPTSPYAEPWVEAKQPMMEALRERDVRWSFGGVGGDELTSLRDFERDPASPRTDTTSWIGTRTAAAAAASEDGIAPATVIHESTLLAFTSRAPQFLRNGLWPVSPLADPKLIRFCEWLPLPWRKYKTLQRLSLARLGLPSPVHSDRRDDPRNTLDTAIRNFVVPFLYEMVECGGVLLDSGFLDGDGLKELLDTTLRLPPASRTDRALFLIASIEIGLRTCSGRGV